MTAAAAQPRPEIAYERQDFERVRSLIHARAGIALHPGKQNMVYGRLARVLRERGHPSFRSYLDALQGAGEPDWQEFVNCLTTNLTSFFREPHHFELLAGVLREAKPGLRIWSCAASTGEEPYSIAMTVLETLGSDGGVQLEASDIDTRVLAAARAAVYPLEAVRGLGEARLRRFFERGVGGNAGKVRLRAQARTLPAFRPFNLLAPQWDGPPCDAIFCRNVMIYFDAPTQRRVLERLHRRLHPGGLLFAGHAENFSQHGDLFELAGRTVYRRAR